MTTPARMQRITPYLTVRGAADAIALYQKVFGATENARLPAQDGKRIMHAELTVNGGTVMLADEFPEHGGASAPGPDRAAGVAVAISYEAPADVDAAFGRAAEAGCRSLMDPHDAFFGARFAVLDDPFGHRWMLTAPLPQAAA